MALTGATCTISCANVAAMNGSRGSFPSGITFDETVITKVPRLLPEKTILAIRDKSGQRKNWQKKAKNMNIICPADFRHGHWKGPDWNLQQSGRPILQAVHVSTNRYFIKADILEKAIIEDLFVALGARRVCKRLCSTGTHWEKSETNPGGSGSQTG